MNGRFALMVWGLMALSALRATGAAAGTPQTRPATRPAMAAEDRRMSRAIVHGDLEAVRRLLDAGASANAGPDSPLSLAAGQGHLAIVKLLLDRGADPESRNNWSCSALLCAASESHADVVKLLLDHGARADKDEALSVAAWHGQTDIVRLLLEAGADPRSKDINGSTPAELARRHGHADTADLIDHWHPDESAGGR